MATSKTSANLSTMSTAERLAFYRQAAQATKPAKEAPGLAPSEVLGKAAADTMGFFSNVKAVYQFHRSMNS